MQSLIRHNLLSSLASLKAHREKPAQAADNPKLASSMGFCEVWDVRSDQANPGFSGVPDVSIHPLHERRRFFLT